MTDIVERLRDYPHEICDEAADEIELLRDALNIAGSALHQLYPSFYDDDECDRARHIRSVALVIVKDALKQRSTTATQTTDSSEPQEGA